MLEELQKQGHKLEEVSPDLADLLRNVKQGKGQPTDDVPTEEIIPEPGFVVKTADDGGRKVFINMCGSSKVAAPGNWQNGKMPEEVEKALANVDNLSEGQADTLRFPLSLGPARTDLDRKGAPCTTYDVIFNLDVIKQSCVYRPLKAFLIELALNWIGHKTGSSLDPKFKLPKMKYKGEEVEAQRIRVDRKPLVTEVREVPDEPTFPLVTKKPKGQAAAAPPAPVQGTAAASQAAAGAAGQAAGSSLSSSSSTAASSSFFFDKGAAAAGQRQTSAPSSSAPPPQQLMSHTVEYIDRPVEAVKVVVNMPAEVAAQAGSSGVQVEVCASTVHVAVSGREQCGLRVQLPVAVSGDAGSYDAVLDVVAGTLSLNLKYLPLHDLVEMMRREAPLAFGEIQLQSSSLFELE